MKHVFDLNDYIEDIELNGLKGRMVDAPARNTKAKEINILFVHGHHSSLERLEGVVDLMMDYGNFCLPDMPGFGGMDHLYSIGEKPTIDNLADYMAAFIKLHYGSRKRIILVGYSMGFLVATRMLQKYPELQKRCQVVVGLAGLLHGDELHFTRRRRLFYYVSSKIVGSKVGSWVTRELFLRKWFLGGFYTRSHNARDKFSGIDKEKKRRMVNFEVDLWRINHVPTWCYTSREMIRADLVTNCIPISTSIYSVTVEADRYFDSARVEEDMRKVYKDVKVVRAAANQHGGSRVETAADALPFFPKQLRNYLKSLQ
jgi:pimeloyl-ACP methyl ester carboxylesterase